MAAELFPDHFDYKLTDINRIKYLALKNNYKIVTTEKDFMKVNQFKNIKVKFTNADLHINNLSMFKNFLKINL